MAVSFSNRAAGGTDGNALARRDFALAGRLRVSMALACGVLSLNTAAR